MLGFFFPLIFFSGLETILFAADVCAWFRGSKGQHKSGVPDVGGALVPEKLLLIALGELQRAKGLGFCA